MGRGIVPSPYSTSGGEDTPSPHPAALVAYGHSTSPPSLTLPTNTTLLTALNKKLS